MARSDDIGWAAGIFEGEGFFKATKHQKTGRIYARLAVKMTDLDVLERFQHAVGCGTVRPRKSSYPGCKQQYEWNTTNTDDFLRVANLLRPWLMPRRLAQLEEIEAKRSPIRKPWHQGRRAAKGTGRTSPVPARIEGQTSIFLGGTQ